MRQRALRKGGYQVINNFLNLNNLDRLSKIICRVVTVIMIGFVVVLIVGLIYYLSLVAKLTVIQIDEAITEVKERVERNNQAIEEIERYNEWLEQKRNREFRERQRR